VLYKSKFKGAIQNVVLQRDSVGAEHYIHLTGRNHYNRGKIMRGYVHVYTGDGKGKTTAALGLAIRAAGAGLKVYIAQFIKMGDYSEIKALKRYSDSITIEQYGLGRFLDKTPSQEDVAIARKGLEMVKNVMTSGKVNLVIMEEANVAANFGLFSVQEIVQLIVNKPKEIELVLTGRSASSQVIEAADLVTEMKMVKHYYEKGVQARVGIEK
jgi:cob(I)alamin adenosyltransferase